MKNFRNILSRFDLIQARGQSHAPVLIFDEMGVGYEEPLFHTERKVPDTYFFRNNMEEITPMLYNIDYERQNK